MIYDKDKSNDQVSGQPAGIYGSLKQVDKMNALIADRLKADPKNYTAWALKGQNEMNSSKWDDAIASFKKCNRNKEGRTHYLYIHWLLEGQHSINDVASVPQTFPTGRAKFINWS